MIFRSAVSIAPRLRTRAKLSVTQPLSKSVSANDDAYLAHTGYRKLGRRQSRRAIYLRLSGQEKYGASKIPLPGNADCGFTRVFRKSAMR